MVDLVVDPAKVGGAQDPGKKVDGVDDPSLRAASLRLTPAGNKPGENDSSKPDEKKYSDADFDRMFDEKFGRKMTSLEKKYGKLDDLQAKAAKLDELEAAKLTDVEKTTKQIAKYERDLLERDTLLAEYKVKDLKRSKLEAKIAAKEIQLPEGATISDVLSMIGGIEEVEIDESLGKLLKLFPVTKATNAATGSGKPPVTNVGGVQSFTRAQISDMQKNGTYEANREAVMKAMAAGLIT